MSYNTYPHVDGNRKQVKVAFEMKKIINNILDFIFPSFCFGCKKLSTSLCAECFTNLPQATWSDEGTENIEALFDYNNPVVKKMIWALKYRGNRWVADLCAQVLYDIAIDTISNMVLFGDTHKPTLVPIPLSRKRKRERGFNQAELLVKAILSIDNRHFFLEKNKKILFKTKDTLSQTTISNKKQRLENIKNCFSVSGSEHVQGKNIILIDDVWTTGGTLGEATRVLKEAGARKVIAFAVAH